jgi:MFS transporter, SP family, galactose:H+ symporter
MAQSSKVLERGTAYLLFVVIVAAFSGFLYGYHTGVIAGALIFLTDFFHLGLIDQGMVVSIILIGALVGAFFSGSLSDGMGRKPTIAITTVFLVIGALLISLSRSYEMLLIGRFVSGIGVGIISLSAPLYLAEISPPHRRGAFVSLFQLAIAFGILASLWVNYLFAASGNWRWMFAIGAFPALFQLFALFFLPETPPWLFEKGREKQATFTLGRLRKDTHWKKQMKEMKSSASPHKRGSWKGLFLHKFRLVLFVGFVLSAFQQITGINIVIFYAPKILQMAGFQSTASALVATLGIGIINVFATALSVRLLDKLGRRSLLLVGLSGMALSLGALALALLTTSAFIDKISVISLMAYVAFFAVGIGPVTWVILSEIYPLRIRGKAMSIAIFVNWVCNYLVSLTFPDMAELLGGGGVFLIYACISALSVWFIYRFIPETKGKSLEEIEGLLVK